MSVSVHKEVKIINEKIESITNGQVKKVKVVNSKVQIKVVPDSGYWEGKLLKFDIKINKYPIAPCKVICQSVILHPNILEIDGEVCLNLFDEDWDPKIRLDDYITGILFVLHNPNFDDPLSDYFCIAKEKGELAQAIQNLFN